MSESRWVHGSGRAGKPRPPSKGKDGRCPKCNQSVTIYPDRTIEKHRVYRMKNGKKTSSWSECPQKKV